MLTTNDYKWIAYKNKVIFIHTWNRKYKITDKNIIEVLFKIFPLLEKRTVFYKCESMIDIKHITVWRKLNEKINKLNIQSPAEDKNNFKTISIKEFLSTNVVNEIKFTKIDDRDKALQKLIKFMEKLPYDIEFLGMSNLKQVPYKIAHIKYSIEEALVNYYYSSSDIYETYIKTISMGLGSLFNKLKSDDHHRWIVADSKESVEVNGYIPLLFNNIRSLSPSLIYKYEFDINTYQNIVVELIKNYQNNINIEELDFKIFCIEDTTIFNLLITSKLNDTIIYCGYDDNLVRVINNGLENLYASKVQNCITINTEIWNTTPIIEPKQIKTEINRESSTENQIDYLLEKLNLKFIIEEWNYNYLLQDTGQTCLKISLVKDEKI